MQTPRDSILRGFFMTFAPMKSGAPIGIFDSGIGGLTVARAVRNLMPDEDIIYFGDTAHLPYGDKSTAAIQAYSVKIADFLLQQQCKVILIACNSASAAAFELVREYVGQRTKVFNVIDPVVDYLREHFNEATIGLIGTKQTVNSGVYAQKVAALPNAITLKSLATPLLVPMIEEGFFENKISHDIIGEYLSRDELANIQALILGCTHYPLIKNEIRDFYQGKVEVIDSAETVATTLRGFLSYHQMEKKSGAATSRFFVSDYTRGFEHATKLFFGDMLSLEKYKLWE